MPEIEKTCFVIQRFDGGKFDKRYREIYKGAIEKADLVPIRADEVLGTKPIIETIENHITSCDAVLADISENNENVFLELGYALSENKPCVIICDKEARNDLPFDIRHRPVIFYDSHSPSSFTKLANSITSNLKAEVSKDNQVKRANVKATAGDATIEDYENSVIGIILSKQHYHPNGTSVYWINRDFEQFGYTETTLSIALASLSEKGFIEQHELFDEESRENYIAYRLTDDGMRYVLDNRQVFASKKDEIPF
jgi:nucleoside 2-deoxyribosyltransferase